ncbi:MAG: histidine--tRNA ligase [Flavobacteriales bacterium AspAUS03]
MYKPTIPKGTRDFSPEEVIQRNYLIQTIQKNFELFGFSPIETPAFEMLSTLSGKYGDEVERLIFKILNSGDFLKEQTSQFHQLVGMDDELAAKTFIEEHLSAKAILPTLSEKALRYDLTVPFARYVVMHQNEIHFPFKRYQIQPIWRADRPQKGRFREFYQCDADVIGSKSLWQEVELIQLYDKVFSELRLPVTIQINHRDVLAGLTEVAGIQNHWTDFTVALDKWDKIGPEQVKEEVYQKGITVSDWEKAVPFLMLEGSFKEKLDQLGTLLSSSERGRKGLEDLIFIYCNWQALSSSCERLQLNITLARGLNYYTGTIFEVVPQGVSSNSIGGGGRYDDLTGIFGLKNVSGVGISFGLDRIYLAIEALALFPEGRATAPQVLFINFGDQEALHAYKLINALRAQSVSAELYPEAVKVKKQFQYADKRNIPFVASIGKDEIERNKVKIKDLKTSSENEFDDIESFIHQLNI